MRAVTKHTKDIGQIQRQEVLAKSREHKDAKMWQDASARFLKERGAKTYHVYDDATAYETLIKAANSGTVEQERKQVLDVLGVFQKRMIDLVECMEVIARIGILSKNEVGEFLVKTWGGVDSNSIAEIQKTIKVNKYSSSHVKDLLVWLKTLEGKKNT